MLVHLVCTTNPIVYENPTSTDIYPLDKSQMAFTLTTAPSIDSTVCDCGI